MNRQRSIVLVFCLLTPLIALAEELPTIRSSTTTTLLDVRSELRAELTALADSADLPAWAAWTVPMLEGQHGLCCTRVVSGKARLEGCALESNDDFRVTVSEGLDRGVDRSGRLAVLLRLDAQGLDEVRGFSAGCPLDAGSLPVYVLRGVDAGQSVDYLSSLAADDSREIGEQAITALAFHAGEAAGRELRGLAGTSHPSKVRSRAVFWLGVARGSESFELLRRLAQGDPDPEVREEAVTALGITDAAGATPLLIDLAREGSSATVRSNALFWLSQKAGDQVARTIYDAVSDDPDVEVKEQAVFGLSQLPPDEGIPLLIEIARSNRNVELRKAALFWLGQSEDPRALELFEEILGGS